MSTTGQLHAVAAGVGEPVVLVHGFTQTQRSWAPVGQDLARDHRVLRVDAPGHGASSALQANLWDGGRLIGRAGGAASYVGYSMGGRLCLHLALAEPGLVTSLVLIGATAGIDEPTERSARRHADEALAQRIEGEGVDVFVTWWVSQPLFAGLSPDAIGLEARRENTIAGLASSLRLAGTGRQDPPLWDRLGELNMPVLIVTGERDEKFRSLGERLVDSIGSNAAMATVRGAGHSVHLEKPVQFLKVLRAFLADLT